MKLLLTLVAISLFILFSFTGCREASFQLSEESRLPKWFDVPDGMSRNDLQVTMDYYVYPKNRIAIFKLFKKNKFFPINKVTGNLKGNRPYKLLNPAFGLPQNYPSYEIIIVNGMTDIIEHRKMEPIFYMTDNPMVWEKLGARTPGK
jgi:hypothetical protein